MITANALQGIPEMTPGADLAELIRDALSEPLRACDIVAIAHKVVSKSEGRVRSLSLVVPSRRAIELAGERDPRLVQVVLDETRAVIRAEHGVIICETHHGFICANAGVDQSNVPSDDTVLMLPQDPDASARHIRARLRELTGVAPGVLISDSFGRAWRTGQADVAIGLAGITPLEDWRGRDDANGREMHATVIAVADLLAGTADLARRKNASEPVVLITGAGEYVTDADGPGIGPLLRAHARDLFR